MSDSIGEKKLSKAQLIKLIGMLFFGSGILITISSAAKTPAGEATFPDTLSYYIVGFILSLTGLIVWHVQQRVTVKLNLVAHSESSEANPDILLKGATTALNELQTKIEEMNTRKVCEVVDDILDNFILPFTEIRHHLIDMFGMKEGSEILVIIAYGERNLNRVWSAAADGHLGEAKKVLPDVVSSFNEALELYESKV